MVLRRIGFTLAASRAFLVQDTPDGTLNVAPNLPLLTEGRGASLGYREHKRSKPSDLVQGTLDARLLKILALEPMNAFAVSQRLEQLSGDVLQVSGGSLYPALHKLEPEGWITAEWKTSE